VTTQCATFPQHWHTSTFVVASCYWQAEEKTGGCSATEPQCYLTKSHHLSASVQEA